VRGAQPIQPTSQITRSTRSTFPDFTDIPKEVMAIDAAPIRVQSVNTAMRDGPLWLFLDESSVTAEGGISLQQRALREIRCTNSSRFSRRCNHRIKGLLVPQNHENRFTDQIARFTLLGLRLTESYGRAAHVNFFYSRLGRHTHDGVKSEWSP
jgi:hypothetical protein